MARRYLRRLGVLTLAAALLGVVAPRPARPLAAAGAPALYAIADLGALPGAADSQAYGLDNAGRVVGTSGGKAVVWDAPGAPRPLPPRTGDAGAVAYAIDATGRVVGSSGQYGAAPFPDDPRRALWQAAASGAVLWDAAGHVGDLGPHPGDTRGAAYGLNAAGRVVGAGACWDSPDHSAGQPVVWDAPGGARRPAGAPDYGGSCPGAYGGIGAALGINDAGQAVGVLSDGFTERAVLWDAAGQHPLYAGVARAINAAGQVAGALAVDAPDGATHAVVWDAAGGARDLGTLPGYPAATAAAIDDAGLVVGTARTDDRSPATRAFVGGATGGLRDLNTLVPADAGWVLTAASGINHAGQIAGTGTHAGRVRAYLLTPRFADLTPDTPYLAALLALADRGVLRGYGDGRVGPADPVLRAQAAGLLARAAGWADEDWPDATFPDQGEVDDALWRAVRALAHYRVALGYADGTYDPTGATLEEQTILVIARAMVAQGAWQPQPDDDPYPDQPGATAREREDRRAIATYLHYVGAVPDQPTGQAWAGWDRPATRGWVAQALWLALQAPR